MRGDEVELSPSTSEASLDDSCSSSSLLSEVSMASPRSALVAVVLAAEMKMMQINHMASLFVFHEKMVVTYCEIKLGGAFFLELSGNVPVSVTGSVTA